MNAFFSALLIRSIIPVAIISVLLVAACSDGDDQDGGDQLKVVASLPLFADMVENVAGDRADVASLLPPGADPHTYEPSPDGVRKVAEADIAFANGLDLEPGAINIIEANLASDAVFVELAEAAIEGGLEPLESADGHEDENDDADEHADEDKHDHEGGDPHIWMDPANGILYAEIIRDTLTEADPEGRATYESNFDAYAAELAETADYMTETTGDVPAEHRVIIATHDAFNYLAHAIDFEVAGFVVPGPGQEPSPGDIADLIEEIEDLGVPAVFSEPQTDAESQTLEQIADDAGVEVCTLYSDAFSETVTTYIDLLRFDAEELARCLADAGG